MPSLKMNVTSSSDAAALYRTSPDDIADRLAAMQHQESTAYRPIDYLNINSSSDFSDDFCDEHIASREKMCAWLHQLVDITVLSRLSVSRAINYLDRFLASDHERAHHMLVDRREYQLAAMTCLYVAIKLHEPLAMDASLLAEISQGCYAAGEILDMENDILNALKWRMNGPTAQECVALILGLLRPESYHYDLDTLGSLLDISLFQCELSAADYQLSMCRPSVVALAAVLNSLDGTDEELLPSQLRYDYLTTVCCTMGGVNMDGVGAVQMRLRGLFRENAGGVSPKNASDSSSSAVLCDGSCDSSGADQTPKCQSKMPIEAACSSPTSVVPVAAAAPCIGQRNKNCFAQCA